MIRECLPGWLSSPDSSTYWMLPDRWELGAALLVLGIIAALKGWLDEPTEPAGEETALYGQHVCPVEVEDMAELWQDNGGEG